MKEKEAIQKELEQLAPLLARQKEKSSPFKLPDDYFDTLENQILDRVTMEPKKDTPTKIRSLSFWLTSAAAILLLAVGFSFLFQSQNKSEALLADISTEEIDRYISDNLYEFDEDLLFEENTTSADLNSTDFSEEEVNLYLEENIEDLEDLDLDYLL